MSQKIRQGNCIKSSCVIVKMARFLTRILNYIKSFWQNASVLPYRIHENNYSLKISSMRNRTSASSNKQKIHF